MTKYISDEIAAKVNKVFAQLDQAVEVLFFGSEDCGHCAETEQLIEEVAALSDQIAVQSYDIACNVEIAAQYHVTQTPTLVLVARDGEQRHDYGIRFVGVPSGHEFSTLIHDLLVISKRQTDLQPETRQFLRSLDAPMLLQVFVTPTCPYCSPAVALAHQMAMESPWVEAEMIEANQFPELAAQFQVSGVPQTTINSGAGTVIGSLPEAELLAEIRKVVV